MIIFQGSSFINKFCYSKVRTRKDYIANKVIKDIYYGKVPIIADYGRIQEIENADIVVTLQPTSPIRDAKDIDKAIEMLKDSDSVVGVCEIEYHPYWTKKIENGFLVPFVQSDKEYFRRQDMPKAYRINGAIYVTKRHVLMNEDSVFGKKASPLVMDGLHSIDIDTELDFLAAEAAMKKIKGKKK